MQKGLEIRKTYNLLLYIIFELNIFEAILCASLSQLLQILTPTVACILNSEPIIKYFRVNFQSY